MRWQFFALFLAVAILGCEKAEDPIEPIPPGDDGRADYDATADHLLMSHVHGGFGVVSRKPDGAPEHQGEALIWGGTSMWALSCQKGLGLSLSLARMITVNGGAMIRVNPLGEYANGREATMDGALGALLGIARRVVDCDEKEFWREPMRLMVEFQNAHDDQLHPNTSAKIVGEFRAVRDAVAHYVGAADEPSNARYADLEKLVGGWAFAVQVAHKTGVGSDACFRVNLGLTALLTLETLGRGTSQSARDQLCANTNGMQIPTVDHWCGREPITTYLAQYEPNAWEYRHQRCSWESPDGDGNTSPRLDKLVARVMAHGWSLLQQ